MSEEDFGTVNVGRQQLGRELELLKQRYLGQRDVLAQLESEAPSEELARRYRELQQEIDLAINKLGELANPPRRTSPSQTRLPAVTSVPPATSAGERPLHTHTPMEPGGEVESGDTQRLFMIIGAALVVLLLLGGLVWMFARDDEEEPGTQPVVTESSTAPATSAGTVEPVATATVPAEGAGISVSPAQHDFGTIRKGTRAVRQFRIQNRSGQAVTVQIPRSTCRCLWFDYDSKIAANSSTILAVTVDGAKAKAGQLEETVTISNKADPTQKTALRVVATIE